MEKRTHIIIAGCLVIAIFVAIVLIVVFIVVHVKKRKSRVKPQHHEVSEEQVRDEENVTEIFSKMYHAQRDHETEMENYTKRKIWLEFLDDFKNLNPSKFHDERIKRKVFFERLAMHQGALEENKSIEFLVGRNEIVELYSSAKICPYDL